PLSNFPSARLAPADTQIFFTLKIDPARLYETAIQTFFAGGQAGETQSDPLSAMAGPNGRRDLIDNLTGEIAVSASVTNLAEIIAKNASPQFKFIGLVEVKNRSTFQPVFARLLSSNPESPSEPILNRNGIEVFGNKDRAWAYVDNYLVLGSSDDVAQAIDMTRGAGTLAATPAFQATLKQFAPSGIGLLFVNLAPLLRSSPGAAKLLAGAFLGSLPAQLAIFAGRKDEEIYLETSMAGPGGSAAFVFATTAAMAIPNLLASRRAANGA